MPNRSRCLFLSLFVGLCACGGESPPQIEARDSARTPEPAASPVLSTDDGTASAPATDALGTAVRQLLEGDWEAHYFDARVDLNGDGRAEVVALVAGPMVCGTGGCTLLVLSGDDSAGYQPVARLTVVQAPVRVSTRSANGWRNLVVGVGGGGLAGGNAELEYDGSGYPSNPTVAPAKPVADVEAFEVLVPEFGSYKDGKPVPLPPLAGTVLGEPVYAADAEELRYRVLRSLSGRYAQEKGIEVTQAEKEAYIQRQHEALQRNRAAQVSRRDELAAELTSTDLTQADRAARKAELESVNETIVALDDIPDPGKDSSEDKAIREEVAAAFIWQWKVNQALYREHGGRIGYQQGGPEPLDAYRKFLEAAKARGDFSIATPVLEADFWRYYTDDTIHSFIESGSREEAAAFTVPWWLAEP